MNYLRLLFVSIVLLGSAVSLEAATATWDANPEPTVTGYRLSYGTQPGVHTTIIDVGNVVTYQFFPPAGQRYYVVVQAYDATGGLSAKSVEVIYDAPATQNQAPVLTQPANQSSAHNAAVMMALVASDPNGGALSYSASGLPPGLTINAATGVIAGTVTTVGTYTVTAVVSDGSLTATRTFTWAVIANQAPTLTQPVNQSSVQNTIASLTLVASDPENATLTYSATGLPSGLTINAATGVIAGTVTTTGAYSVTASVSDGSLSASRIFTWTVTAATGQSTVALLSPVDTSLRVEYSSTEQATRDRLYSSTFPDYSPYDAILMRFDLSQIPANAVIQSAALQLSLVKSDSSSDATYAMSLHQIINRNPDVARATARTIDGTTAWTSHACCSVGMAMAQGDISAARATTVIDKILGAKTWDALSVVQDWRAAPASNYGLLLNADLTKLSGRYRQFASMEYAVASERPVLRVTYTVPATGGDTTAPTVTITAPANNATVSGTNVSVTATAADAVGVAGVQFRLDGVNIGAEDTTAPYSITWNSMTASNGSHVLTAVARDAAGNSATATGRTVIVSNVAANNAPTLTQPANQTTAEGAAATLALVASDPDGNPLTFSATGLPAGLTINATSGSITGTPSFTSAGIFSVTATVSDGTLSASRTFSWTITNTNRAPVLTQPANQTSAEGAAVSLSLSGSDPDSDPISFNATGLPGGVTINVATGVISGTLSSVSAGTHTVTATITDGSLSQSRTFSWTVTNVNRAPVFTQPANQTSAEGAAVTISMTASDPDGDALSFTATGLPAGVAINASTGAITGTPTYTSAGTYNVTVTVADSALSQSRTFSWIVTNTNRAPVLAAVANQTTAANIDATLQIVASDPDGTALTYSATGLPPALTISATTGLISGHVNSTSAGVHAVTVTVTDSALSTSVTFVWSVDGTDVPVTGDYDGDGRDDPATYREATGEWRVWMSNNNFAPTTPIVWGTSTDVAVPADYDGDGRTDIAVYRRSTGTWHALLSSTNMQSSLVVQWGNASDRPEPIDYDNDGRADLALPRFGGYVILLSGSNYTNSVTVR